MERKKFRIGTLAKYLEVERFVIRFWEQEFNLKSDRSDGRQRYYTQNDIAIFNLIKDLLYNRRFTIAGAKEELARHRQPSSQKIIASQRTTINKVKEEAESLDAAKLKLENERLYQQIAELQKYLKQLQQLL